MSRTDENLISIYERKILRFLFGGIRENETWRRISNLELYQLYKEFGIVNFIKIERIKWAGQVIRMNEDRTTKKVFNAQPIGTRREGRPNLRRIHGLEKHLLVLRTRSWRTLAGKRLAWKRLLEKTKAHPGLSCD
ncbi:uncharacterized protein TNCV_3523121 [Trichonephila clavipes]|uniref:Uncharacterized protein n=1 Tax=Trichonephila clavipes TaxID=2585209 RepID=A0A8X6W987_TRICX|nr:uncharacterized protein TNCV_3523121 [Trichonephila clavipes]